MFLVVSHSVSPDGIVTSVVEFSGGSVHDDAIIADSSSPG